MQRIAQRGRTLALNTGRVIDALSGVRFSSPAVDSEIEHRVQRKLDALCAVVQERFGVVMRPEVAWDLRGQAAGQANGRRNLIRFNRELAERYSNEFVAQTVPHELAHLVAFQKFGGSIRPHGREWQAVIVALGAEPRRTHCYEVTPTRKLKRFFYQCHCPDAEYQLTAIRHNRIQRGHVYICKRCLQPLGPKVEAH